MEFCAKNLVNKSFVKKKNRMTGVCAIYSGIVQTTATTKSTILSLTSTTLRYQSQLHVRRNSIFACANQTSSLTTAFSSDRKLHALSSPFNTSHSSGPFFLMVSLSFIFRMIIWVYFSAKRIDERKQPVDVIDWVVSLDWVVSRIPNSN